MAKKIRKGTSTIVINESRKFGADPTYIIAHLDGNYLALTEEEYQRAVERASNNIEDTKKVKLKGWL